MGTRAMGFAKWLLLFLSLIGSNAWAQSFPSKPIHIIVPFTPGGGNDRVARAYGQKLQERHGQPVVVDNKPGASGNIGAEYVAKSAPDGYTLLLAYPALTILPWLSKSMPFDVMKDFGPIGIGATMPMVVVVATKLPIKSIQDLIDYAKANPGKLSYATPGIGTSHHVATELFMQMTGTKMVMVPYKGAAGMLADLTRGEVHVMFGALNSTVPLIRAGKIRAIALAERQRVPMFKDLPTVSETLPGYAVNFWFGLMAPAGTPEAITTMLSDEMRLIVGMPDVRERLAGVGFDSSNPTSPAEMHRIMAADLEKWGKVIKAAGIKPQ